MAINRKYSNHVWHIGETATPFTLQLTNSDGSVRTDVASATFTLIDADTGSVLIDAEDCQSVENGLLSYSPTAEDLSTACRFLAQFTATLSGGHVLPSRHIEGEIQANL